MKPYEFKIQSALGLIPFEKKCNMVHSSNTSADILDIISRDVSWALRVSVAQNSNTSPGTLEKLSKDRFVAVRLYVAMNPSTLTETLEKLLKDRSSTVRHAAQKVRS